MLRKDNVNRAQDKINLFVFHAEAQLNSHPPERVNIAAGRDVDDFLAQAAGVGIEHEVGLERHVHMI